MKKIYLITLALALSLGVLAQSPEKMSYQAVVRDASNILVKNQSVGMQISILQGSATGTAVYVEEQTPTSNSNGLVTIEIGEGTVITGTLNSIDWSNGPYFIKTETDPAGGTNYTISGTSQLMSVPYALHATTAENVVNDQVNDADADSTNEIQAISISNDTIYLSNGGFVKLPSTTSFSGNFADLTNIPAGLSDGDDDTQLSETQVDAFVNNNGYLTTEVDGSVTNEIELPTGGNNGQVLETDGSGNYTWVDQTVNTNTQLTETQVDAFVNNNGYLTTEVDGSVTNEIELPTGGNNGQVLQTDGSGNYTWVDQTVNTNTQLSETQVDAFVNNNGYLTTEVDGSVTNEIELPTGGNNGQVLQTDGSGNYTWVDQTVNTNTQLTETQVDAFVNNNGYLTTEVDGSVTNEIELPTGGNNGQVLQTDGSGNYTWVDQTTDTQLDSTAIANLGYVAGSPVAGSDKQISFNDGGSVGADAELVYDKTNNRMAIGTSTISNNAALEVSSTTGGFMLPRMTTVQRDAISNPQVGLMIFNTDSGSFQGFAGYNGGVDLTIDHNTFLGTLTFAGQSFTAVSNSVWSEVRLDFQTASSDVLTIYAGNTTSGTPIHTQAFNVGAGQQGIVLSTPIQLVAGQQYTVTTNSSCAYYPFATYPGGSSWTVGLAFPGDLWMQVITGNAEWKDLHD